MRKCPKCEKRLSPLYFKTLCPHCGADLLYYHFDERLERDAQKAAAQEKKVKRLLTKLPFYRNKHLSRDAAEEQPRGSGAAPEA